MATKYPKHTLNAPIASAGQYKIPPERKDADGRFSLSKGFDEENSKPPSRGGIPPFRQDFNGLAYLLSEFLVWYQQGGIMNYTRTLDYEVGNEVNHNGKKWRCYRANGPHSGGTVEPSRNPTYWKPAGGGNHPGEVVAFYNVRLGGSDGRRPIFWGESLADEGWVLADGGSDGRGGNVPNLMGRSIEGARPDNSGVTTGGTAFCTAGVPVGAVIHMAGTLADPNREYLKLGYAQEFLKSDFPAVSNSLGNRWGSASTSAKFKTPDVAGRYIRSSGSNGESGSLGSLVEAGIPNITGSVHINFMGDQNSQGFKGAFYNDPQPGASRGSNQHNNGRGWSFDASRCSDIYGRSDTVTPKTAVFDTYLKVKPSTIEGNAGHTGERLSLAYFVKLPD